MHLELEFVNSIKQIDRCAWQHLAQEQGPFLQYEFLAALENSGAVNAESGWQPQHLAIYQNQQLTGILPLYIKGHSYGEYVFDFAWANAYQQHGQAYYPKLISAIPFTPVTGTRLLMADTLNLTEVLPGILSALQQRVRELSLSSLHWLFVTEGVSDQLTSLDAPQRLAVQFQWFNRAYTDFAAFLDTFTARRRKSIRKEREKVAKQGVTVQRLHSGDIQPEHMAFFYECYCQTYYKRSGHQGYLNRAFFDEILTQMPEQLLLVIAHQGDCPVASALYLFDKNQLCGRYWGAVEDIDGLHFECCYYQGIEFCIEQGISSFNPGTQGEHKILRGFEPITCFSNHWLADPAFHQAIERFVEQEKPGIEHYKQQAETLLPYKSPTR